MVAVTAPSFPRAIEQQYERILVDQVRDVADLLRRVTDTPTTAVRLDAWPEPASILRVLDVVKRYIVGRLAPPSALPDIARAVDRYTTAQQVTVIRQVAGIRVAATPEASTLIAGWAGENAARITTLHARYLDDVGRFAMLATEQGWTIDKLGEVLGERLAIGERRARLLARDQVGTLSGQITRHRHEQLGITHYGWSTSGDERVRPEHEEREGRVFAWADPPSDGHPGEPILCRCTAIPQPPGGP